MDTIASQGALRVPTTYATIAEAIQASKAGDVIALDEGVYKEPIRFLHDVTIIGTGEAVIEVERDHTILNADADVTLLGLTGKALALVDTPSTSTTLSQLVSLQYLYPSPLSI